MNLYSLGVLALSVISLFLSPVIYIVRSMITRIEILEAKIETKITEERVRMLLSDKLDPIHQDVAELSQKLDKILEHLIKK